MNWIKKISIAPLTYIADLRQLTLNQYLHRTTNFSPSYPIMIFSALLFTLMYSAFILYFVFNQPNGPCFAHIRGAVYILAILYPLQSILCFICLTGTIALSKSKCWKVTWMLLFGPILCGFGFGQVGLVQACILQKQQIITIPSLFAQPGFIDTLVYLYIAFLSLYFLLIPSINFLYRRQEEDKIKQLQGPKDKQQKGDESEAMKPAPTCCRKLVTCLYYTLNVILCISFGFIFLIKIFGPIFYTFTWIQIAANAHNIITSIQKLMLALLLLAYFAPLAFMLLTLALQRIIKLTRDKGNPQFSPQDIQKTQKSVSGSKVLRDTWNPKDPQFESPEDKLSRRSISSASQQEQQSYEKKTSIYEQKLENQLYNIQGKSVLSKKEALL